jgi:carboxyl-terminal processing protease
MIDFLLAMKAKFLRLGKKVISYVTPGRVNRFLSYVLTAMVAVLLTLFSLQPAIQPIPQGDSKLSQLIALIDQRYVDDVDLSKLEDVGAEAIIGALGDRWSYYISAEDMAAYNEQKNNTYVGIGITVTANTDGGGLKVTKVTPGGSAEAAGVQVGDVVIGVDGQSIVGMDINAISALIRGEVNTYVSLTLQRTEEEITVRVKRQQIKTPVAVATLLDNGIGLIQIKNFNANCASETIKAIQNLQKQGATKLIFDVRNNGGGYADEMIAVLDYLLPEGDLFRTVDYTGREDVATSDRKCVDMPMVVLVNGRSYSAAEFFAAALYEYEVATVVGEQTSGKGYFQVTYELQDGSAVALSIGKYYTPKGNSLEGVGITPGVVVPVDEKTAALIYAGKLAPMEDPQILRAIEALNAK